MLIHLFSPDEALCERWENVLSGDYQLQFHKTLAELNYCLYTDKNSIALIHIDSSSDVEMPPKETLELAATNAHKLVILSNTPTMEEGYRLLAKGVRGYSNCYTQESRLLAAIRLVEQGDVWISHQVMQAVTSLAQRHQEKDETNDVDEQLRGYCEKYDLFERDRELLLQMLKGITNQEISEVLTISERTVKARLASIYQKTNTRNKLELTLSIQKFNR